MDELDRAQAREEEMRADALKKRYPSLPYTGHCHWCGDITGGGRVFCGPECRDDWQREREAARRAGRS